MILGIYDLHLILDAVTRRLKLFDAQHELLFECEARNRTVLNGQYGHYGNCPPGSFLLGIPSPRGSIPFGNWFIPILDYGANHVMREHGRSGIGIHGGGSGLADPFAPRQGWQITHGCWRVQNEDLGRLVGILTQREGEGGVCYVTVTSAVSGDELGSALEAALLDDDWAPIAELVEGE